VTCESVGRYLTVDVPEENDIIHTSTGDVLAGRMKIEAHDGLFVAFERSDETGVFFGLHFWIRFLKFFSL
jgi:hypothetical protein